MKKFITTSLFAFVLIIGLQSQNLTQASIVRTDGLQITVYAKPTSTVNSSTNVLVLFALSLPGTDGPVALTATSLIGGAITPLATEIINGRKVYPFSLEAPISTVALATSGTGIATVTFPLSENGDLVQINDYTGSGTINAYWYISYFGSDGTDYVNKFYGTNAVNNETGDSKADANLPLPITLISFNAQKFQDRSSHLTWSTSTEVNGSHFNIQRSFDNKSWSNVGRVNAVGNSQLIQNYEFMDANVYNGTDTRLTAYYRLQAVDLDGTYKNSLIKSVVFTSTGSDVGRQITVYPNPSSEGVYVKWDNSGEQPSNLEFFDINGKLAYTQKVAENSTEEYVDFSATTIIPGLYIVRILGTTEIIDTKQIIVDKR